MFKMASLAVSVLVSILCVASVEVTNERCPGLKELAQSVTLFTPKLGNGRCLIMEATIAGMALPVL